MIDVDYILRLTNYIINKHQTGDTLGIAEYNDVLEAVNLSFFNAKYKKYEEDITSSDDLAVFKTTIYPTISATTGRAVKPLDYLRYSKLTYRFQDFDKKGEPVIVTTPVEVLTDSQVTMREANPLTKPTKHNPCCRFERNYIQFYPFNIGTVEFTYLRYPRIPVYAATLNPATDEYIYDPANSIQFEYDVIDQFEIVFHVLQFIGVNLQVPMIMQYAEQQKAVQA